MSMVCVPTACRTITVKTKVYEMRTQRRVVGLRVLFVTEYPECQCTEVMGNNDHYYGSVPFGENFDERLEQFLKECSEVDLSD